VLQPGTYTLTIAPTQIEGPEIMKLLEIEFEPVSGNN
jgi:hypothetical protein